MSNAIKCSTPCSCVLGRCETFWKAFTQGSVAKHELGIYMRSDASVAESREVPLNLGHVYPDADDGQHHPHASRAFVGRAHLLTHHFDSPGDPPAPDTIMHSMMLAVPLSMHRMVLDQRPRVRSAAALVPWSGSGIGLLVVSSGSNAVLGVADIAGRADLTELQVAARRGKFAVGLATDADPSVTPLFPVDGFAEALSDARSLRRLAAREFVEAVAEVRSILRRSAGHFLGMPPAGRLDTLTVNTCPL